MKTTVDIYIGVELSPADPKKPFIWVEGRLPQRFDDGIVWFHTTVDVPVNDVPFIPSSGNVEPVTK